MGLLSKPKMNETGCFGGHCLVSMADGSPPKRVDALRQGDLVLSMAGTPAEVVCVIETQLIGSTAVVELESGLCITPWHPIRMDGQWTFPADVAATQLRRLPAVYSLVLNDGHSVWINQTECISLGHDIHDDPVASHPFFGSLKVINQLKTMQ